MTDLLLLLDSNWNSLYVAKPDLVQEPQDFRYFYKRVISIRPVQNIEDYMDIFTRGHYTPESHEAYDCYAAAESKNDCDNIANEVKRICIKYGPNIIVWEGGDYEMMTDWRWEFRFVIMVKKSGEKIPNI